MLNVLGVLRLARKIGWRGWLLIFIAGAMAFLWIRGNRFQVKYQNQIDINHRLERSQVRQSEGNRGVFRDPGGYHIAALSCTRAIKN